jgi:hypothetical protein
LPPGTTPNSLRHTFASLLFAIGEDPVSVMRALGDTDPAFALRVYAHSVNDGPGEALLRFEQDRGNPARAEWVESVFEPTSACVAIQNRRVSAEKWPSHSTVIETFLRGNSHSA